MKPTEQARKAAQEICSDYGICGNSLEEDAQDIKDVARIIDSHIIQDREHIVQLNLKERAALAKWLENPNGSHRSGRVNFEVVVSGGILVRTQPHRT